MNRNSNHETSNNRDPASAINMISQENDLKIRVSGRLPGLCYGKDVKEDRLYTME